MTELTREQLIDTLENGWGKYVMRFHRLSPQAQAEFLEKQGYARLSDILAHVVAWWEEGLVAVEAMLTDPNFHSPNHDVDGFNARAVARFKDLDEAATIQLFERTRLAFLELVQRLPTEAFQNKRIADRLHIEVIGHWSEHAIA